MAAGLAKPRHADAVAHREVFDSAAQRVDPADDLMTGDDRQQAVDVAICDVQVGPAHAARRDLHAHLARPRLGQGPLDEAQSLAWCIELHGLHHLRDLRI